MNFDRRAVFALAAAGMLWGCTVPATKLAVQWLPPGWLTVVRFGLAAAVLLVACRSRLRAACSPAVLAWGAVGYGGTILVQNEGVMRTSVSHAALLVGATPVLVAIIAALRFRSIARPAAWAGYAVSLGGVCLVAGAAGGSATMTGDGLILVSLLLSASFTVAQTRVLDGRDPLAVTALQFLAATVAALPVAVLTEGMPPAAGASRGLLVTVALALGGTLLPFALFAFAQSRVSAATAAPFLNLEPLVGAAAGVVAFGDPFGLPQIAGAAAIVAGIAVSSVPLTGLLGLAGRLPWRAAPAAPPARWSGGELAAGRLSGPEHAQGHRGGHRQDARGARVEAGGHRGGLAGVGQHVVGVGVRRHQCDDPLTRECRADLAARRFHGAHDITVRAARQRGLAQRADAAAHHGVRVAGPYCLRPEQDLAGAGLADLGLLDLPDAGTGRLVVPPSPQEISVAHRRFYWPSQRWPGKDWPHPQRPGRSGLTSLPEQLIETSGREPQVR
jgi:O-acetylserine/cysteine efflux transporter